MKEDKFLEVFDFQYTASEWAQIKRVIDKQPGKYDEKAIREMLELNSAARRWVAYCVVPGPPISSGGPTLEA